MIAGSFGVYAAVSARDHVTPLATSGWVFDSMIVNSSGHYLTQTVHDREAPWAAAGSAAGFLEAERRCWRDGFHDRGQFWLACGRFWPGS
jgi:hypothetical protein